MVSIENLEGNMVKMSNEVSLWRDNEAIEVEEESVVLTKPVSLPKLVKKAPKTIDMLSTIVLV